MKTKRIFILNGHPGEKSLSRFFAETYAAAAMDAGHLVRLCHIHDLEFDSDFGFGGYQQVKPLEPALETVLEDIEWSEHVVLTTPMWWGGLPAKLKGLIDRAFLPGRTFDTHNTRFGLPAPMLAGRSARVIMTADTPGWFMRWVYKNAMLIQVRRQILGFVGIKPSRFSYFASASHPREGMVERWAEQIKRIAAVAS
ncbi:NAD(P)H-dependent oxidoreductase [Gynuella sunshinyii]|uniref:Putative NADPH-quinone reductase (Modulator of drug activity B) n=1 Tax=Gynuella sunshinyii YC6258 TaxID=1445510 RepID=A0A0C5VUN7_9GAMM|nr:NAD(P)H-dependent oxidoreductase [Gynuella sunshinyii]AJQ94109.1 putative NADPH-quinone reductase (modulator of drug activity B) [Gynuella sunshinyii YC6258]